MITISGYFDLKKGDKIPMKQIALIGPTASGKTSLSITLAQKTNAIILSLDSLLVYKEINIASAKPTKEEQKEIIHFGIDTIYPNQHFNVMDFITCYYRAYEYAKKNNKNLIIVGGSSFYLKILIDGISKQYKNKGKMDISIQEAFKLLVKIDPIYMSKIEENDKYRIEKAYLLYKNSNLTPTQFFLQNKQKPIITNLPIFEIAVEKEELSQRIKQRTKTMLSIGLIDEVIYLEKKYTRGPNCMNSIGITETLDYLDGKLSKKELEEKISTNTSKLAKRQKTFNKGQFNNKQIKNHLNNLSSDILKYFSI